MEWGCLCGLGAGSRLERGAARGGRAMRREERARLRSARDDRSKRAGRAATSGRKNSSQDTERAGRQRGEGPAEGAGVPACVGDRGVLPTESGWQPGADPFWASPRAFATTVFCQMKVLATNGRAVLGVLACVRDDGVLPTESGWQSTGDPCWASLPAFATMVCCPMAVAGSQLATRFERPRVRWRPRCFAK